MLRESFYVPSVVVARSETTRRIGGFDTKLRSAEEDQDFFIRMALAGKVGFIDRVLVTMHEQPGSFSRRFASHEHETTLPMILHHCRLLRERLSRRELREILGARYSRIGRNVYLSHPLIGARLLVQAIALGREPLMNLWYLNTASPWGRWAKRHVLGRG
jgi:GT2 family glycosyltransferase